MIGFISNMTNRVCDANNMRICLIKCSLWWPICCLATVICFGEIYLHRLHVGNILFIDFQIKNHYQYFVYDRQQNNLLGTTLNGALLCVCVVMCEFRV